MKNTISRIGGIDRNYGLVITSLLMLFFGAVLPAKASVIGFQLNFNVISGSTTLGGKTLDSGKSFIGVFSFESNDLMQPITTVAQNLFTMDFTVDGMDFSATNSLGTIEIQKLFSTQPDEVTRLRNGLVTLDSNLSEFVSFSNTGTPPSFLIGNGVDVASGNYTITSLGAVPLPGAFLLFLSALPGVFFLKRK